MAKRGIFNDPIAPSMRKSGSNFKAPTKAEMYKDPRFMAGDNYGSGFKNPVGKMKVSKSSVVPEGCSRYKI